MKVHFGRVMTTLKHVAVLFAVLAAITLVGTLIEMLEKWEWLHKWGWVVPLALFAALVLAGGVAEVRHRRWRRSGREAAEKAEAAAAAKQRQAAAKEALERVFRGIDRELGNRRKGTRDDDEGTPGDDGDPSDGVGKGVG